MDADRERWLLERLAEALGKPEAERVRFLETLDDISDDERARLLRLLAAAEGDDAPVGNRGPSRPATERDPSEGSSTEGRGSVIGPYKLLGSKPIGEGGFGVVWMAERQRPMHQRVALKIIKPGMDSKAVLARFEQERQALAMMDHPNVSRVFDAGTTPSGRPYFVMEYIAGEPITAYCDRNRLNLRARLELLLPVCEAVQHAHHKGLIHRDLKPANIIVAVREGKAVPKVIDFGIAKAVAHTLGAGTVYTEQGQFVGTPEYMSPEQAEMGTTDVDTRSDVYSLGVLLYELLTGSLPLERERLRQAGWEGIRKLIREEEPERPSTRITTVDEAVGTAVARNRQEARIALARELRRELDWIPLKALRKDRTQRYATPLDLADDIRRYLQGEALEAGPESSAYRMRKFSRRYRGPLLALGSVLAALTIGAAVSLHLYRQSEHNAAQANEQQAIAKAQARVAQKSAAEAEHQRREAERFAVEALANADLANQQVAGMRRRLAAARLVELREEVTNFSLFDPDIEARQAAWSESAHDLVAQLNPDPAGSLPGFRRELEALRSRRQGRRNEGSGLPSVLDDDEAERELRDLVRGIQQLVGAADDQLTPPFAWTPCSKCTNQRAIVSLSTRYRPLITHCASCNSSTAANFGEGGGILIKGSAGTTHTLSFHEDLTISTPANAREKPQISAIGRSLRSWADAANHLREQTVSGTEARLRWDYAITQIANTQQHPAYNGLIIRPQLGILPIGENPSTGLWEFWHVLSGDEPSHEPDGTIRLEDQTGIVLALVPGGTYYMGSQSLDATFENFDVRAEEQELPVRQVTVPPFMISRTETSLHHWTTVMGEGGRNLGIGASFPAQVTWNDIQSFEARSGLRLPSESEWELAARGKSASIEHSDLVNHAWIDSNALGAVHPIARKQPTDMGLYDIVGNVAEWCEDNWHDSYSSAPVDGRPWVRGDGSPMRVVRGGSARSKEEDCRPSARHRMNAMSSYSGVGFRVCLSVD